MSRSRTKMATSLATIRSKRTGKIVEERIWTLDSHFADKIVTERILIMSVSSKIVLQPLEPDTDAQLHKERVISVRKEPCGKILPGNCHSQLQIWIFSTRTVLLQTRIVFRAHV